MPQNSNKSIYKSAFKFCQDMAETNFIDFFQAATSHEYTKVHKEILYYKIPFVHLGGLVTWWQIILKLRVN